MALTGVKALHKWCQLQTESYSDVNVINMTSAWRDGMAFCAIIHKYRPDLIDFNSLDKKNIYENNKLAFDIAEQELGINSLLDAEDMVSATQLDKLSILTYVSQFYSYFTSQDNKNGNQSISDDHQQKDVQGAPVQKRSKASSPPRKRASLERQKEDKKINEMSNTGAPTMRKVTGELCYTCNKKVYIMERLVIEARLYHRSCFRCKQCRATLKPGGYTLGTEPDQYLCNHHVKPRPAGRSGNTLRRSSITSSLKSIDECLKSRPGRPATTGRQKSSADIVATTDDPGTKRTARKDLAIVTSRMVKSITVDNIKGNMSDPRGPDGNASDRMRRGSSLKDVSSKRQSTFHVDLSKTCGKMRTKQETAPGLAGARPIRKSSMKTTGPMTYAKTPDVENVVTCCNWSEIRTEKKTLEQKMSEQDLARETQQLLAVDADNLFHEEDPVTRSESLESAIVSQDTVPCLSLDEGTNDALLPKDLVKTETPDAETPDSGIVTNSSTDLTSSSLRPLWQLEVEQKSASRNVNSAAAAADTSNVTNRSISAPVTPISENISIPKSRTSNIPYDEPYNSEVVDKGLSAEKVPPALALPLQVQARYSAKNGKSPDTPGFKPSWQVILEKKWAREREMGILSKDELTELNSNIPSSSATDDEHMTNIKRPTYFSENPEEAVETVDDHMKSDGNANNDLDIDSNMTQTNVEFKIDNSKSPKLNRTPPKQRPPLPAHLTKRSPDNIVESGQGNVITNVKTPFVSADDPEGVSDLRLNTFNNDPSCNVNVFSHHRSQHTSIFGFLAPTTQIIREDCDPLRHTDADEFTFSFKPESNFAHDNPFLDIPRTDKLSTLELESYIEAMSIARSPKKSPSMIANLDSAGHNVDKVTTKDIPFVDDKQELLNNMQDKNSSLIIQHTFENNLMNVTVEDSLQKLPSEDKPVTPKPTKRRAPELTTPEVENRNHDFRSHTPRQNPFTAQTPYSEISIYIELEELDGNQTVLEERGVQLEKALRNAMDCPDQSIGKGDDLLTEWFELVNAKNALIRRESELIYILKEIDLEERHEDVEFQLRLLIQIPESVKTDGDMIEEEHLLAELVDLVDQRNAIVEALDKDRLREAEEDRERDMAMSKGGVNYDRNDIDHQEKLVLLKSVQQQQRRCNKKWYRKLRKYIR